MYQQAQTLVYPKPYFVGLLNKGAYYVSPNTQQKVQIVAVDADDRPLQGFKARIDLVRFEWHSVLRQHPQTKNLRYVSERREIAVRTDRVTLGDGPYEHTYTAPRSGEYALRVSKDGDTGYNQVQFYAYSWGTSDITSFEIDPEARVEIVLDKPLYARGTRPASCSRRPSAGRCL